MTDDCPNDEELGRIMDGTLAFDRREQLRRHLAQCSDCRAVVVEALRHDAGFESTETALPLPRAGRYVLGRVLGMGGMGVVYAADDPELGRAVAIKLMRRVGADDPNAEESRVVRHRLRMVREGQSLARVVHPNVVSVYDVGQSDGQIFVAMELVEGGTLRDWITTGGHTFAEILAMFRAIGAGLAAVHDAGLVHRDFKPENVLLGADGRPRVTDFGLARQDDDFEPEPQSTPLRGGTLTQTGALLGTPVYMAPEQLRGEVVGPAADVFAFAVTLWEALFGKRPFSGETVEDLDSSIRSGNAKAAHPPPPGTPSRRVRALLGKALVVDPSARPKLRELLAALERLRRPSRLRGPLGVGLGAATMALVLLGGAFGWEMRQRRRCDARAFATTLSSVEGGDVRETLVARLGAARGGSIATQLARYVDDLDAVHRDACSQTFVQRTLSDARYRAQRACLDRLNERLRLRFVMLVAIPNELEPEAIADAFTDLHAASSCVHALPDEKLDPSLAQVLGQAATARAFHRMQLAHDLYRAALSQTSLQRSPAQLAEAQAGYGEALVTLGDTGEGQARLEAGLQSALYASDYALVAEIDLALLRHGAALQHSPRRVYELAQQLHWASERGQLGDESHARASAAIATQHERDGRLLDAEIELRAALATLQDPAARAPLEQTLSRVMSKRK